MTEPRAGRMKIDGACHCGKIGFEAEINPEYVVICHCTDCQTMSGAPYRASVPAKRENFTLSGEPKTYVKIADSGTKRMLAFCGECGTALYSTTPENQQIFNVRLGAVRQRAQLPPKSQGFCRSAMPWAMDIRDIRRTAEPSSGGSR